MHSSAYNGPYVGQTCLRGQPIETLRRRRAKAPLACQRGVLTGAARGVAASGRAGVTGVRRCSVRPAVGRKRGSQRCADSGEVDAFDGK